MRSGQFSPKLGTLSFYSTRGCHVVSERGIEVDQTKIEVIKSLPQPTCVKVVQSFLRHAGF